MAFENELGARENAVPKPSASNEGQAFKSEDCSATVGEVNTGRAVAADGWCERYPPTVPDGARSRRRWAGRTSSRDKLEVWLPYNGPYPSWGTAGPRSVGL